MKKKYLKWLIYVILQLTLLIVFIILSIYFGSVKVSFKNFISSLVTNNFKSIDYIILFQIRIPRIILAFAVGSALSLSGAILQGLFRNALVDSYTIGISGGAALIICLNIVFGFDKILSIIYMPVSGFIGALITTVIIYSISIKKNMLQINNLLLVGVMISFISSSTIMLCMCISRVTELHSIIYWIMGSLEESNFNLIVIMLISSIVSLLISYLFSINLNTLSLGEEESMHLGINVEFTKKILFVLTSILTGLCVSVSGLIGFVGLVIPHIIRIFFGTDYRILLISSYLSGGAYLILCDTFARTIIAPNEVPVGAITGLFGGIIFIYIFLKNKVVL